MRFVKLQNTFAIYSDKINFERKNIVYICSREKEVKYGLNNIVYIVFDRIYTYVIIYLGHSGVINTIYFGAEIGYLWRQG